MRARLPRTFDAGPELNRVQGAFMDALKPLVNNPLNGAILVGEFALVAATPTSIAHKLGERPQGWLLVAPNAAAQVYELARDSKTFTLESDSDVTFSLLVF